MIRLSSRTKLLIFICLANFSSEGYCKISENTVELNCNITTQIQNDNSARNVTTKISAINRCPRNYANEDIIKKCENLVDSKLPNNEALFKPVANSHRNVTYWNEYCAACNNENNLEYWSTWTSYARSWKLMCFLYGLEVELSSVTAGNPHEVSQELFKERVLLKSMFNTSTSQLQCSMEEKWPLNLMNFVVPCMIDHLRADHTKRLKSCQYIKNNGQVCLKMKFIVEGLDFFFGENGRIDLVKNSSSGKEIKIDDEYVFETGINNVVYQCEPDKSTYKMRYWVKIVSMVVSIIFMIIYLFVNFNDEYFQCFPNKVFYSYSIGLTVMYSFLVLIYLLFYETCVAFFLVQFSWFFHFFWTMLLSLEFCRLTYCTFRKRLVSMGAQPKRFLVYCFVGFVVPALLPVIYFYLLIRETHCQPVSGYIAVPCLPQSNSMAEYFMTKALMVYHWSFLYLIPPLFLLQASVIIYITKCGPTPVRSTANRNNFLILMKMAYIMGAHWMLYEICVNLGHNSSPIVAFMSNVFQYCTDFQGVFVFLAFGVKKKMLKKVWNMCLCKFVASEASQSGTELNSATLQTQVQSSE